MRDDPQKVSEAIFGLFARKVVELVAERRTNPLDPQRDLVSGILAAEMEGAPLAEDAIVAIGVQVIAAGYSTTSDAMAGAIYRIATSPEIQARLRRDPALIPAAVEEFLRLEVPLPELGRTAGEDMELHGRAVAAGCPVALNFGAANRDAEEFPHPEACIIDRTPNRHLTFGHGVHKCVGAPFARLELRVALEQLLARTADISLAGRAEPSPAGFSGGFKALPISLR
jgi:cytochrome P450